MKKLKRLALTLLSALMIFSSVACQFLPTSSSSVIEGLHQHKTVHRTGITPNCQKVGKLEHWECVGCGLLFAEPSAVPPLSGTAVHPFSSVRKRDAVSVNLDSIVYS